MSTEAWAVTGILVSLIVGIPAFFIAKKSRSNRQQQDVRSGGRGYQSGRDMNIDK